MINLNAVRVGMTQFQPRRTKTPKLSQPDTEQGTMAGLARALNDGNLKFKFRLAVASGPGSLAKNKFSEKSANTGLSGVFLVFSGINKGAKASSFKLLRKAIIIVHRGSSLSSAFRIWRRIPPKEDEPRLPFYRRRFHFIQSAACRYRNRSPVQKPYGHAGYRWHSCRESG